MNRPIKIGISTCPNDTFAFHALLNGLIDTGGVEFDFELLDVEQLNVGLLDGKFDLAKASFHAALLTTDETVVMRSGSALGFGVGPVLLSHQDALDPKEFLRRNNSARILCPGKYTTATLLYKLFYNAGDLNQVVFSDIMPALESGTADFGVCIHEGRFSYAERNLFLIEDLGSAWESKTNSPLPLGGILGRRRLGVELLEQIQSLIQRSIEYANENRSETLSTMRKYAQEFSDEILLSHVDLYVNDWTINLGSAGSSALRELNRLGKEISLIEADRPDIEVL